MNVGVRWLLVVILICAAGEAASQQGEVTVTHYAGLQIGPGYTDGMGSSARLVWPGGVVVDRSGIVYFTDRSLHTVRSISPGSVVQTLAGIAGERGGVDGRGAAARFAAPGVIAADQDGNLYVGEWGRIRKISAERVVTTLATTNGDTRAIAVDRARNVYYSDLSTGLQRLTPSGVRSTVVLHPVAIRGIAVDQSDKVSIVDENGNIYAVSVTGDRTWIAGVPDAFGLTVDSAGNLYVATWNGDQVKKITPAGVVSTVAGSGAQGSNDGAALQARFCYPIGVAAAPNGDLFVADVANAAIRKISTNYVSTVAGAPIVHADVNGPLSSARFDLPIDIVTDSLGNMFVADARGIKIITPQGDVRLFVGSTVPGTADGRGSTARFDDISALAIDRWNTIYVCDNGASTIRKVSTGGVVTTFAGRAYQTGSADGTGTTARFRYPVDLVTDTAGNVYVTVNQTIRKITKAGVVSTLAGVPDSRGASNGIGSAARFSAPQGITIDEAGVLYVTDSDNYTIRRITTPEGLVSNLAGMPGLMGLTDGLGSAARIRSTWRIHYHQGLVYFSDSNHIRTATLSGQVLTVAGMTDVNGSSDGTGSNVLLSPAGFGGSNDLYLVQRAADNIKRVMVPGIADRAIVATASPQVGKAVHLGTDSNTGTKWNWSFLRRPTGSSSVLVAADSRTPSFTPDVADTYILILRVEGSSGLRYSTVRVTPLECPAIGAIGVQVTGATTFCRGGTGGSASVAVTGGVGGSTQWGRRDTPSGATLSIAGATASTYVLNGADFPSAGTYYLVATVTSSCGLVAQSEPPVRLEVLESASARIVTGNVAFADSGNHAASVPDGGAFATYWWGITNGLIASGDGTRTIRYTAGPSGAVTLSVKVVVGGCVSDGEVVVPISASPSAAMLYLVAPCRVIDTRGGPGLGDGAARVVSFPGHCGIPSDASAVAINITAVTPSNDGFLAVYPANEAWLGTSTTSYRTGRTRANSVIARLSPDGSLSVYNAGGTGQHFIIDVTGYFP